MADRALKKQIWIASCVILSTVILYMVSSYFASIRPTTRPNITLQLIDGSKTDLADSDEKVLLINFWSTSCLVCMQELPELIALYEQENPHGLEMIAIAMPYDPPNLVLSTSNRYNIPFPISLDINGGAMRAFGDVKATPSSFLIAQNGMIVARNTGKTDFKQLKQNIRALISNDNDTNTRLVNRPRNRKNHSENL